MLPGGGVLGGLPCPPCGNAAAPPGCPEPRGRGQRRGTRAGPCGGGGWGRLALRPPPPTAVSVPSSWASRRLPGVGPSGSASLSCPPARALACRRQGPTVQNRARGPCGRGRSPTYASAVTRPSSSGNATFAAAVAATGATSEVASAVSLSSLRRASVKRPSSPCEPCVWACVNRARGCA